MQQSIDEPVSPASVYLSKTVKFLWGSATFSHEGSAKTSANRQGQTSTTKNKDLTPKQQTTWWNVWHASRDKESAGFYLKLGQHFLQNPVIHIIYTDDRDFSEQVCRKPEQHNTRHNNTSAEGNLREAWPEEKPWLQSTVIKGIETLLEKTEGYCV